MQRNITALLNNINAILNYQRMILNNAGDSFILIYVSVLLYLIYPLVMQL